uniref:Williams-Beuren syndrome chromosomal region 27 protein-like n=1 Tax=Phallusia mammillata TaxID=59560 RepID=A0A6F9DXI1_9ASCI|nr:Williams-Beuren syndrome chromosomal region 27 protein-like [Phallusia mammillata]
MDSQKENDIKLYNKIYGDYINVESTESTVANYTKLAEEYEQDFVGLGYETPGDVAKLALKYLKGDNQQVLDIACGTGLVADALRNGGFKGEIDGIDGSPGMLNLAKAKQGVYRKLVEAFVNPGVNLPFDKTTYDAVVCSGGYGPGHLMPATLELLIDVTKAQGVIVFATRDNTQASDYVKELEATVKDLEDKGLWKKSDVIPTTYFRFDKEKGEPLKAIIYCFQKV